jgi:predicted nuclease of predicted toxin-antitoxin system
MLLNEFIWITDENIHPELISEISGSVKVFTLKELGLLGSTDTEILLKANSINGLILTHDSDFGKLAFLEMIAFVGVVYLRSGHFSAQFHLLTIRHLLEQDLEVHSPFIIVAWHKQDKIKIRIKNRIGEF